MEPKPQNTGRKPAFSKKALQRLEQDVLAHPDATLHELRERSRVKVSIVSFQKALRKLSFTQKKVCMCARATPRGNSSPA